MTLLYSKSSKPAMLIGLACFLLLLHWATPATQLRVAAVTLIGIAGCWLALLQHDLKLKLVLLSMFTLNLAALGLERNATSTLPLLTLLYLFVLA